METPSPTKRSWPVLLGGFVLVLLFALAVKALFFTNPPVPEEDVARAAERAKALEEYTKQNAARLGAYGWFDKAKGQVQIPIEQAMALTVVELNNRPPAPAGPINPPPAATPAEAAPAPPAAAAAPANPAPPAPAAPAASPTPTPPAAPAEQPAPAN